MRANPRHRNAEFHRGQVPEAQLEAAAAFGGAGGSVSPLTTKGDLYTHSTVDARLAVGANGQVLSADSAQATGLAWASLTAMGARVYNSGAFSVGASSETAVTFDTERSDTGGFHSTVTNTSRLTVPTGADGRYVISGAVEWAASALGTLRRLSIRLNGSTYIAKDELTSIINAALPQNVSTVYDLAAGDYVELVAFQDTVGAVNLSAAGNYSPEFGIAIGKGQTGADGAAGSSAPVVVQEKQSGTAIGSIVLGAAPANGHAVVLALDGYNTGQATAVSSTNTTWTQMATFTDAGGARHAIWIGVVAGGAGGTTITITHPNAFMSAAAIEITDALAGTAGGSTTGDMPVNSATDTYKALASITTGHLVAIMAGCTNTAAFPAARLHCSEVTSGLDYGVVALALCYSRGQTIYASEEGQNAGLIMVEIT